MGFSRSLVLDTGVESAQTLEADWPQDDLLEGGSAARGSRRFHGAVELYEGATAECNPPKRSATRQIFEKHYKGLSVNRDLNINEILDIAEAEEGHKSLCPSRIVYFLPFYVLPTSYDDVTRVDRKPIIFCLEVS